MELNKKAAYLQGLVDGLGVDESTKEGKIIKAMAALLGEMADAIAAMDEDLTHAYDQINDLSEELEDLEADLYEDEDAEDEDDDAADVPDNFKFCKENELCKLLSYKGKVFSVEIPNFIELEVTQTEPGVKGNTATNTLKPATVETGAEIRVPLFINEGDHIRIDTRTGEYMERV